MYEPKCPCGRSPKHCNSESSTTAETPATKTPADPQSPSSTTSTTPPSSPTIPNTSNEETPSYGDLVAQKSNVDDPDEILEEAKTYDWEHCFALVSGGYDSVAAAYYTYYNAPFSLNGIIHVDTNIGLEETTEYVKEITEDLDVPLYIANQRRKEDEYETRIEKYGFPGATKQSHKWEWINLKDKPLQKLLQQWTGNPLLISGARQDESDNRQEVVSDNGIEQKDNGNLYASPIASWSKSDVTEFIENNGIPESEVVEKMQMSGDCFCGCFAERWLELDRLEDHYPYMHTYIQSLEARVMDAARNSNMKREKYEQYVLWGHGGQTERERGQRMGDRTDMTLCQSCEPAISGTIDGNEFQTLIEYILQLDPTQLPEGEDVFKDAFDVTQAIPNNQNNLTALRNGYKALDEVSERLGYRDHKEMVERNTMDIEQQRDKIAQEFGYDSFDELIADRENYDSLEELIEDRHTTDSKGEAIASKLGLSPKKLPSD